MHAGLDAGKHGAAVERAAAAMDYQVVLRKVAGKIAPPHVFDGKAFACAGAQQAGNLHGADVLLDGVVRAGLGDKHARVFSERVDGKRAQGLRGQVALEACEGNGKAGKGHVFGNDFRYLAEGLRVGNYQRGRLLQCGECLGQLFVGGAERHAMRIKQVADGLHLGQDEASLGCLFVQWDNQHHYRFGGYDVAQNLRIVHEFFGRVIQQRLAEIEHAFFLCGAHANSGDAA